MKPFFDPQTGEINTDLVSYDFPTINPQTDFLYNMRITPIQAHHVCEELGIDLIRIVVPKKKDLQLSDTCVIVAKKNHNG